MKNNFLVSFLVSIILCCYISYALSTSVPLIPRSILFGNQEKTNPAISSDGTHLAYCAPLNGVLNIWVKNIDGLEAIPITQEANRGIYNYWWSYTNNHILYLHEANGDENYNLFQVDIERKITKNLTPFPGVKTIIIAQSNNFPTILLIGLNKEDKKFFDVYRLDLEDGSLAPVAKNPGNVVRWCADSNLEVRAAITVASDGGQELIVRDSAVDEWRPLLTLSFEDVLHDELYCGLLGFSADGNYLYLNTSYESNTRSLIKMHVATGSYEVLASDPFYDVQYVNIDSKTQEPDIVFWNKERGVVKGLNEHAERALSFLATISDGDMGSLQKGYDNKVWIVGFAYDTHSFEYYQYNTQTNQAAFLFSTRPLLNKYSLNPIKPITFVSRDGLNIHGYLTLPLEKQTEGELLPLVVLVHGGPFSRDVWGYNPTVQLLANRGYAVLQINFRGSKGYGKSFLAAGNGEWGNKMHHDIVDGVSWAIKEGFADPKKIAIFGASYGGYEALVGAILNPELFCCAVDMCGPTNLITLLNSLPSYWPLAPWEKRIGRLGDIEFLKSRSPLFKIDSLSIPLFIAHGANDVRVTQQESEQLIAVLKNKGIPYTYLLFPDEGHGFSKPQNRVKFYAMLEEFLAHYLGGRCEE